ncbi:MAG: manganese catalase family protein [Butyricicoccus pullicaecorum]|nr:manganese catalase family protein [Butyricicoccus pullicaecorum]
MWNYEKKLQYPVKISNPNPAYAKIILTQLGGPDGEMGATTRYLNQRYTMPYATGKAILTDIATEEADHYCCISSSKKSRHMVNFLCLPYCYCVIRASCIMRSNANWSLYHLESLAASLSFQPAATMVSWVGTCPARSISSINCCARFCPLSRCSLAH